MNKIKVSGVLWGLVPFLIPTLFILYFFTENYILMSYKNAFLIRNFTVRRLGELFRKLWNPRNFKSHVSPHEMLQAVSVLSKKRFKITRQGSSVVGFLFYHVFKKLTKK